MEPAPPPAPQRSPADFTPPTPRPPLLACCGCAPRRLSVRVRAGAGATARSYDVPLRTSAALRRGGIASMLCQGPSMVPTLNPYGDVVLLEKLPPEALEVGDVVMARSPVEPDNPEAHVCKRVRALPGGPVPRDRRFARNDAANSEEEETVVPLDSKLPRYRCDLGCILLKMAAISLLTGVWLQGDNLHNSTDSREYGPVPLASVLGRVIFRVWPEAEAGPIGQQPPDGITGAKPAAPTAQPWC